MTRSLISRKHVRGEVEFNDGEFAEIQTVGIEGIEKDLRTCYYKPSRSIVAIRAIPANSFNTNYQLDRG